MPMKDVCKVWARGRPFFLLARSQKEWDPVFGKEMHFLGNIIPVPSTTEGISG